MKAELRRQERELAEMEQQRVAEAAAAQAAAEAEAAAAAEAQAEAPPSTRKGPHQGKGKELTLHIAYLKARSFSRAVSLVVQISA